MAAWILNLSGPSGVDSKSDSDTGTVTENETLDATSFIQDDDAPSTAELQNVEIALQSSDSASGVDNPGTYSTTKNGADDGTAVESAGAVAQTLNKSGTDSATGSDSPGSMTRQAQAQEFGTGSDAVASRVSNAVESATGADSPGSVVQRYNQADTASGTDTAGQLVSNVPGSDAATATDNVGSRTLNGGTFVEPVTVAEAQTRQVEAPTLKSGSETVSSSENAWAYLPGGYTKVPSPREWTNGDPLDAGTLNKEWRDTFNWILGYTAPAYQGYNSGGPTLSPNVAIPILTSELERGNLYHAANDTKVSVYETGYYLVWVQIGLDLTSATGSWFSSVLKVNGAVKTTSDSARAAGNNFGIEHLSTVFLNNGDYLEIACGGSWTGTVTAHTHSTLRPSIGIWWRGK